MSTVSPDPPTAIVDAARRAWDGAWLWRAFKRSKQALTPVHMYVIDLDTLATMPLSSEIARPVAWRFVTPSKGDAMAIDVDEHDLDVQIERGPIVQRTLEALRALESEPEWTDASFARRVLRIPDAYITAIWLTSNDADADVVVPLSPAPMEFEANRRYAMPEFLTTASSLARQRIADYSATDRDSAELGS